MLYSLKEIIKIEWYETCTIDACITLNYNLKKNKKNENQTNKKQRVPISDNFRHSKKEYLHCFFYERNISIDKWMLKH